jgi:hypothetical protein
MLAEFLTWLVTPAPWLARRFGYLQESVAIAARYHRCRLAWEWARAIDAAHWEQLTAAGVPVLLITDVAATWRSLKTDGSRDQKGGFDAPSELEPSTCSQEETPPR